MPLPRKKDEGTAAPVLDILAAHVRLFDIEEHETPYVVTRKSDGTQFTLDPGFTCTVEAVDDGGELGTDNGTKFFENFKYKQDPDGQWFNKKNSKLGALTAVVKPGYFEDPSIPDLTAEDLEGFEMLCRIKPKKHPNTGQVLGSTIDWETMQPLPKSAATVEQRSYGEEIRIGPSQDLDDFEDLPF